MYIEVLHDMDGVITGCYCADTLPLNTGAPFFTMSMLPAGSEQSRINIDTLMAMEIDAASGQKAVIDATGKPVIVMVTREEYIVKNYTVDVKNVIVAPVGLALPSGMNVRSLLKK